MESLLEQITRGRLWPMSGGVHPPQRKALSNSGEIGRLPLAARLYIPIRQHIGESGSILVKSGDVVFKGQPLTSSTANMMLPVHSSTSGRVVDICEHVSPHPSGIPETTIVIEPDGKDVWLRMPSIPDAAVLDRTTIVERIKQAGISGLGGAGFPSHIKAGTESNINFLIINGVECEPYITSDDRLMREKAEEIIQGVDILNYLLEPQKVLIAIEDNKPEAIDAMRSVCKDRDDILIKAVPTVYPAGGEKQLIQILTGLEIPVGKRPVDIGIVSHNVGSCYAMARAVHHGEALVERVVTITGKALNKPGNCWLPIGTPISHVLEQAEYQPQPVHRVIVGGPMMGFAAHSDQVPVVKITNCLLVPDERELPVAGNEMACIRCGQCADACPARLLPQQLYWYSKNKEYDKASEYNLSECIECGACAFVCPSEIPLVQYYRVAKADIRQQQEDKTKADKAKLRFEARNDRLERDKQEREEKHRKAAEARKNIKQGSDQQAAVAAALARAKAKKAQTAGTEQTAEQQSEQTPPQNAAVAAAIARAKAKKEAQQAEQLSQQETTTESDKTETNEVDSKKAAVAAAIARAKAKKDAAAKEVAQSEPAETSLEQPAQTDQSEDPKRAAIAAAVARAKAKKLAAQQQTEQPLAEDNPVVTNQTDSNDDTGSTVEANNTAGTNAPQDLAAKKKAAIAAAIAKAKTKQAEDNTSQESKNGDSD